MELAQGKSAPSALRASARSRRILQLAHRVRKPLGRCSGEKSRFPSRSFAVHRHPVSRSSPRFDRQVAKCEAHIDLDAKRPEAHEIVNNAPSHGRIIEQARLRQHFLVVKGDALVRARIVEMPPRRAGMAPSESELLVIRPLMDDPGPRVGGVRPVKMAGPGTGRARNWSHLGQDGPGR